MSKADTALFEGLAQNDSLLESLEALFVFRHIL